MALGRATTIIDPKNRVIEILADASETFYRGAKFHHAVSLKMAYMNLHGAKRWHKIQSGEDWDCYEKVAYYLVDMYDHIVKVQINEPSTPEKYKEYLMMYLEWETYVNKHLNDLSKELVELGALYEAELITAHVGGVIKEIEKIKRWLDDYEMYEGDIKYIKMADAKLHDKLKKKTDK